MYVYLIVTKLKTSGFTDTSTSIIEGYLERSCAEKALEKHKKKSEKDFYYGKPSIKCVKIIKDEAK